MPSKPNDKETFNASASIPGLTILLLLIIIITHFLLLVQSSLCPPIHPSILHSFQVLVHAGAPVSKRFPSTSSQLRIRNEEGYSGEAYVSNKRTLMQLVRRCFLESPDHRSMATTRKSHVVTATWALAVMSHLRRPLGTSPQSLTSLLSGPAHVSGGHGSGPGDSPAVSS